MVDDRKYVLDVLGSLFLLLIAEICEISSPFIHIQAKQSTWQIHDLEDRIWHLAVVFLLLPLTGS